MMTLNELSLLRIENLVLSLPLKRFLWCNGNQQNRPFFFAISVCLVLKRTKKRFMRNKFIKPPHLAFKN